MSRDTATGDRFEAQSMKVRYAAQTHLGMQRKNNEDNYYVLPEQHVYIVADGMGGHASGEVASLLAVNTLADYFIASADGQKDAWPFELEAELDYHGKRLSTGIRLANQSVHAAAQKGGRYRGMGTTIVGMVLGESHATLAHVGDSRGYRIADGAIEQLTEDHSLVNEYIKLHKLRPEDVKNFSHKNVIVRALGLSEDVDVDIQRVTPQPGDTYLLCSDGLTDMLSDKAILKMFKAGDGDLEKTNNLLIDKANDAGGNDNITIVLIRFD
jgi:protein phosphatase